MDQSPPSRALDAKRLVAAFAPAARAVALGGALLVAATAPSLAPQAKRALPAFDLLRTALISAALSEDGGSGGNALAAAGRAQQSCRVPPEQRAQARAAAQNLSEGQRAEVAAATTALGQSATGARLLSVAAANDVLVVPVDGLMAATGLKAFSVNGMDIVGFDPKAPSGNLAPVLGHELTHANRSHGAVGIPTSRADALALGLNGYRERVFTEESIAFAAQARVARERADAGLGGRLSAEPSTPDPAGATAGERYIAGVYDEDVDRGLSPDAAQADAQRAFRTPGNLATLNRYRDLTTVQWTGAVSACAQLAGSEAVDFVAAQPDDFTQRYGASATTSPAISERPEVVSALAGLPAAAQSRFSESKLEAMEGLLAAWRLKGEAKEAEEHAIANGRLRGSRARLGEQDGLLLGAVETTLRTEGSELSLAALIGGSGQRLVRALDDAPLARGGSAIRSQGNARGE